MVGGCCVCSDERGWAENPLVYCDGHGCSVAVHQACYGIVQVPTGPWFCRKCESQERAARVRCELCPHKNGALKRTDSGGWAHVVCALYIPEVQFANVLTMEPIILQYVPHDRYIKTCYICEDHGRESKAACGACMTCNRQGCRQAFHVTCAQMAGLLCEEEGPEADNVKYCGYCKHHYNKMQKKLRSSENTSSSFSHSRGRSSSPPQDKHHHHRQRKSHKDKMHQKERHKKSSDSLGSSVTSCSIEKISSSHHSTKDSEGKCKKLSSHTHVHRSKKTGSIGKSCSSSSCSSSPFNTGGSLSSAQDFHPFSSSSRLERDHDHGGDEHSGEEPDGPMAGSQGHDRSENNSSPFENKVTISTFGSIMRITSSSGLGSSNKIRKISSSGDYKPSKSLSKLSTPPILEEVVPEDKAPPPQLPRERRHRGNKKSSHGPGRPRGTVATLFSAPASTPASRTPTHWRGCLQYPSLPGWRGLLTSHISSMSLPSVNAVSNTQVPPAVSPPPPTLPPLLTQAQTSLPESDLDDCRFPCQGNSPRESLSSQSPMSCLPLLFEQRDGLGAAVRACPENVPLASSHIELLLEKHSNGEMGVNIVEMLQSLHSLQQENQRLQDQILSLTAKKERLQLLNTELAISFPPHIHSAHGSMHSAQVHFLSSTQDPLSTNKSPLSKSCFLNDTSFVTLELHSGSPSRSSSSLSFQSTPPPQQSPASFGQPLLNGFSRGMSDSSGAISQPVVGGLMSSLAGSPQLNMNGVLGSLNGVIQSPVQNAPLAPCSAPPAPPAHPPGSGPGLPAAQERQPEQQVMVCQMLQRQRELQRLTLTGALTSTPNSPLISQSPSLLSSAAPLQGGPAGSLFGLQDNALHKSGAAGEKGGDKNG
ncbi:hypothetical protein KUCAC02_015181 [Chaenocephalus aceratus]|uniref:Uncharacterized protein n=1 Tax=Chaenocephalus aceratus TaxID=36190 RepID=A0ACB9XWK3_CHAAC|nr:hypothetical protein KUCAC02_015181 [Chaenocephalus aceratus]